MGDEILKCGKLAASFLDELLTSNRIDDPRVLLGPQVGRDVAVVEMAGGNCLVATADPITFATERIGWYAVQVNANDIATAGATPKWFLATILLPEKETSREMVEEIYADLVDACRGLGVELIGGHTEITAGLDRPIISGQMLGEVSKEDLVRPDGARPGDVILLTKRIAIEGTAILGMEFAMDLANTTEISFPMTCARFLEEPGIAVVHDALIAFEDGGVHAMHDPTEGGLATGLWELAQASGCGLRVVEEKIPVYSETQRVCDVFGLDPLGMIASGALLIVAASSSAGTICAKLRDAGIECCPIGDVLAQGAPCRLITSEGETDLPAFERDEIARLYGD